MAEPMEELVPLRDIENEEAFVGIPVAY